MPGQLVYFVAVLPLGTRATRRPQSLNLANAWLRMRNTARHHSAGWRQPARLLFRQIDVVKNRGFAALECRQVADARGGLPRTLARARPWAEWRRRPVCGLRREDAPPVLRRRPGVLPGQLIRGPQRV